MISCGGRGGAAAPTTEGAGSGPSQLNAETLGALRECEIGRRLAYSPSMQSIRHSLALIASFVLTGISAPACTSSDGIVSDAGAREDGDGGTHSGPGVDAGSDAGLDASSASCPVERSFFYDGDAFTTGTRLPLATVCDGAKWGACPADLMQQLALVAADDADNTGFCWATLTTGCGTTTVNRSWGTHGALSTFDSTTGKLIGYAFFDDVPFGFHGCRDNNFFGGVAPPTCATSKEQILCSPSDNDAGVDDAGAGK